MARTISEQLDTRLDSLRNGVKDLIDAGSERAQNLKNRAMTGMDKTTQLIKDHPLAAVAIAFGVGYIAMRILRR